MDGQWNVTWFLYFIHYLTLKSIRWQDHFSLSVKYCQILCALARISKNWAPWSRLSVSARSLGFQSRLSVSTLSLGSQFRLSILALRDCSQSRLSFWALNFALYFNPALFLAPLICSLGQIKDIGVSHLVQRHNLFTYFTTQKNFKKWG